MIWLYLNQAFSKLFILKENSKTLYKRMLQFNYYFDNVSYGSFLNPKIDIYFYISIPENRYVSP
jgi:hypothetical protein